MRQPIRSLNDILFNLFANEKYADPQENKNVWAINEGISRLNMRRYEWQTVKAQKEHECIRGHKIKVSDIYCKNSAGGGWGNDWKFCLSCAAMILYFLDVEKMPPYTSTHWNYAENESVLIEEK